jgi:nicotinamidase-related amidase
VAIKATHNIKIAKTNPVNVDLLCIDNQVDFSFPPPVGSLYVSGRSGTGAMDAQLLLAKWAYKYTDILRSVVCTMDTHFPYQIFFPLAHIETTTGKNVAPNTVVTAQDYKDGKYTPSPAMASELGSDVNWLRKQFTYYCEQLEMPDPVTGQPKKSLYIWPYHCLLGTPGHALTGVVQAFRVYHSILKGAFNLPQIKGGSPLTENYSVFAPEVMTRFDGMPIPGVSRNVMLIYRLLSADMVVMAGLASSHCVLESVRDFIKHIKSGNAELMKLISQDPKFAGNTPDNLLDKVYLMKDCTAPVVIPGIVDFTDSADDAFKEFEAAGMHVVESTTPIQNWPSAAKKLGI